MSKALFPDISYEYKKAKEIGFSLDIDQITCISSGTDRLAFGSDKLCCVVYTLISSPFPQRVDIELPSRSSLIRIEWFSAEPYFLLVIFEQFLVIIDTQTNSVIHLTQIENSDILLDAHWTSQGNILSLSKNSVITLYDSNLENPIVQNEINNEQLFCFAVDGNQIYVGQARNVKIYTINPDNSQINEKASFIAHPHNIEKILVTTNYLITMTDNESIAWNKNDLVPLFPIKCKGSSLFVDPDGFIGIIKDGTVIKLMNGKKSEIMKELSLKDFSMESISAAAWYNDQTDDSKFLIIAGSKEPCVPYVIKFTHT